MSVDPHAYRQLLEELFSARRLGVVLGLHRLREVLTRLGNPERSLGKIVHVGGTNGKGSTVALLAAMLRAHGLSVAQYTSPHLATVRERITYNEQWIDHTSFLDAARRVRQVGGAELTFFEQITAIAMVALAQRAPDVSVLEVGLGGRLDATNVVESAVAVVTGVAFDHQAILGHTLDLIAAEKAGIFRAGRPAIIGASGEPEAVAVLLRHARDIGATPVHVVAEDEIAALPAVGLCGAHQRHNAATAMAAMRALVAAGHVRDDAAACHLGLARAQHPGRFEVVAHAPITVLDGAHNPHGARALAAAVASLPAPRTLVVAVSSDKDVAAILDGLLPPFSLVIATAYDQDRSLKPDPLAGMVAQRAHHLGLSTLEIATAATVVEAMDLAWQRACERGSVVVAGSLFVVGEARVHLLGGEVDPIRLSDPSAHSR